ncbi:MAG: FAD-dependent oxidoreductase [Pseudomonadota bacterium]
MTRIVVVGGGQAGASLVMKLRALGHQGPLDLICAEPVPPYQRPPLSKKYLLGEMAVERLFLKPEAAYGEAGIGLHLGRNVTGIDRDRRVVVTEDGSEVPYDLLALTTGSRPRLLPDAVGGALDRVYPVRALADVDAMAPEVVEGRQAVIVGGGYIGLEAAAVLAAKGVTVTVVEMAERILQRVAAEETSDFFRALHRSHGVDVREGVGLTRLTGTDSVTGADLTDGTHVAADFAVIGIGIVPEDGLARDAGLTCDNGIAVDALGRTSDPAIFAAGDCATFPFRGETVRLESVQNAIDQAEAVAEAMLGSDAPYVPHPWFWSDQFDIKLQIAGLNAGYDRTVLRPGARAGTLSVWYYRGAQLLAVDAMNDPRSYMMGKRMIENGISPDPALVADPESDLKSLLS